MIQCDRLIPIKDVGRYILSLAILLLFAAILTWYFSQPNNKLVILCLGDSLTAEGYPNYLKQVLLEKGIGAEVVNLGINGHTSGEYLNFLDRTNVLEKYNPDFVLLQLGTNDVRIDADHTPVERFTVNIEKIIVKILHHQKKKGGYLLIASIPPIIDVRSISTFNNESIRRVNSEINPAIMRIARKWHLVLVDNYGLFPDCMKAIPHIHPTAAGYRRMAENWCREILKLLPCPGNH